MKAPGAIRRTAAVGAVLLVATACGGSSGGSNAGSGGSTDKTPYKFAFTGPLSGPVGEFISPAEQGLNDYFKYVTSKGGVDGHPIQLNSTDIVTDVPRAVAAMRQAAGDKSVLAVTGLGVSGQIKATLQSLETEGVAGISITSGDPASLPYSKWYFSFGDALSGEGDASLAYALKDKPTATVAFFTYDTPAEEALAASVKKQIAGTQAKLIASTLVPPAATDVSVEVTALVKKNPDIILSGGATSAIFTSMVNTAKTLGYKGRMILAAAGGDDGDFARGGNDTFSYEATRNFRSPSETSQPAVAEMLKHVTGSKPIRQYYTSGWVLGMVMEAALKDCGNGCDRAKFRDSLEKVTLTDTGGLAAGTVGFDTKCHQGFRDSFFYKWDAATSKAVDTGKTGPWYVDGPCARS